MRKSLFLLLLFGSLIVFEACRTQAPISGRNVSQLYTDKPEKEIQVDYLINHVDNGQTSVTWRIDPAKLGKAVIDGAEVVSFVIRYRVYNSYSDPITLDSGQIVIKEKRILKGNYVQNAFNIQIPKGRNHLLDISLHDLISPQHVRAFIDIVNPEIFSTQCTKLIQNNGQMVFGNVISEPDSFILETTKNYDRLYVKYYNRTFVQAAVPFATLSAKPFDFIPDSVFEIKAFEPYRFRVNLNQLGFYQITSTRDAKSGATYFNFGNRFPKQQSVNDLLYPLIYLTSSDEFKNMAKGDNIKQNMDVFWIKLGGSEERAKKLISAYYGRVEKANIHFTSYTEGWKTDRGMCYIIFGPPNLVYKSTAAENWVYGEEGRYKSLSLSFTKVTNPFVTNDFRLNRYGALRSPWYRAVDIWRQGRILTYK